MTGVSAYINYKETSKQLQKGFKIETGSTPSWYFAFMLFEMVCTFELGLTVFYWAVLYKDKGRGFFGIREMFTVLLHTAPLAF